MNIPKKVKVTYFYDALCGWCFGMTPSLSKLYQKHQQNVEFEVISGGLFLDERAGKVNDVAPHIKKGAYKLVEERTGVKFGKEFLSDLLGKGDNTLDSLLPAIALCIVKESFPERTMEFATSLTRAVYADGIDSIDINAYTQYAIKIGFEESIFQEKIRDKRYESMAQQDFLAYQRSGVRGFPTLVIESEKGASILAQGQSNFSELDKKLSSYLA
jgi:putative protein-disulfide isomerase